MVASWTGSPMPSAALDGTRTRWTIPTLGCGSTATFGALLSLFWVTLGKSFPPQHRSLCPALLAAKQARALLRDAWQWVLVLPSHRWKMLSQMKQQWKPSWKDTQNAKRCQIAENVWWQILAWWLQGAISELRGDFGAGAWVSYPVLWGCAPHTAVGFILNFPNFHHCLCFLPVTGTSRH